MTPAVDAVHPVRGVVVPIVAIGAAGVPGGMLWARWADPAAYAVTRMRATLDEEQLGRYFGVEVRYAVIGLVVGFVVAAASTVWLRRAGWPLVVGVSLGAVAAAAVSYQVGVALGPPDVDIERAAAGGTPGEAISVPLEVQTPGMFLAWEVGGLLGLLLVVSVTDRDRPVSRARHLHLPDLPRN